MMNTNTYKIIYSHEDHPAMLVEKLLNDPATGQGVTVKEMDAIYTDESTDDVRSILYQIYQKADDRKHCCTLKERLNILLERGDVEILTISSTDRELVVRWCGMIGGIIFSHFTQSWNMHT